MKTVFSSDDLILECRVEVEIKPREVKLTVGGREMTWDRRTGEIIDAGCMLDAPLPEIVKRKSA